VAPAVEQEVLGLDVAVGDAHRVEVVDALEHLAEVRVHVERAHRALLDGRVEVAAGTVLHNLAPVARLVLDEVDRLDDVEVVERRRDAKLGRELLDIVLLGLILAALAELLRSAGHGRKSGSGQRAAEPR
jgi:hypothetical protein